MSLRHSIRWKNLPLACKLSVPALVFGLSLVSVLVSVNAGLEDQRDATLVVNVAGRQRMLNQRLAKEVLERKTDPNVDLKCTIELLETSARALLEGGPVQLGEGQSSDLPAASSEHEGLLSEQVKLLHELEAAAFALDQDSSVEAKTLHELELCTRRFHKNANDLVIALQADSEASLSALVTRATVLAALAILLGVGITLLVARQILASIRAVSDGIRRIAEGDLGFAMSEDRNDELGRMAQHVNTALNGIRASVGNDAVDWAEVARQKENQERLRSVITMVEHAPGGLLHTDAEGRLAYINPAAADLLRRAGVFPSSEDGLGVDLGTVLRPLGCPRAGFQSPEKLPWSMLAEQGGHHLQLGAAAILDEDQNFIGTLLSIEEITERVRNEEAARDAADRERRQTEEIRAGVQKILGAVDAAANGDLRVRTGLEGEEPVERVGIALDRFLEVLQKNMLTIAGNIEQLSASADELSRNGAQLGEGADATAREANSAASSSEIAASNVSSMAAAIEEMTASMSEISRSAHSAAKVANRAVDAAEESNRLVSRLGDRSREIGDVIKVISAIADQTNLLALNATIEAARAGDAGKGFAVVAHEVKELASETARATEEISNRIDVIQHDIELAVNTIQDIGEIINQINESQATIAAAVEEQSATTNEMGNNVHQTAASTDVIRSSITAVASQAELTAMGSKQTEDASRLVKSMAEELERLLSVYEVAAQVRPSRSPSLR